MASVPAFKPPKNLAVAADQLYSTREHRLALQKEIDALQAQETALREHIINNLPKSQASGIAGKLVNVSIVMKDVASVNDWDAVREFIKKRSSKDAGVWALINKAINQATVKDLWSKGVEVPGVEKLSVPTLSMNKL